MMLRDLKIEDAGRMLEWMHDPFVVEKLQTDFSSKTIEETPIFLIYTLLIYINKINKNLSIFKI